MRCGLISTYNTLPGEYYIRFNSADYMFYVLRFLSVLSAISFIGCSRYANKEISIGIYCGECPANCFSGYTLKGDSTFRFSSNYLHDPTNKKIGKASAAEAAQMAYLVSLLPAHLNGFSGTYGCPDCH